jgi:hypothetical protein
MNWRLAWSTTTKSSEPTDRNFWEKRSSKKTLQFTDSLLDVVKEIEPNASLNYTKHYIGLKVEGSAMNFVTFLPRRAHVIMTFKLPQTQEVDEEIAEASCGLNALRWDMETVPTSH